jgi:hypothetical protein
MAQGDGVFPLYERLEAAVPIVRRDDMVYYRGRELAGVDMNELVLFRPECILARGSARLAA